MAFQRSDTVTMNLVLVFCLVAVINNVVTVCSAREINKNPSDHEKAGLNNIAAVEDPNKNKKVDKNQLPYIFPHLLPLPIPFPRFYPGVPLPFPIPIPGRTFPTYYMPVGVHPEDNFPGSGGAPSLHVPAPPPK